MAEKHSTGEARIIYAKFPRARKAVPKRRPRYHYPRVALEQRDFTINGLGQRLPATLDLSMLTSRQFQSQLETLLSQLSADGYDVQGCEAEFQAMKDALTSVAGEITKIERTIRDLKRAPTSPLWDYSLEERIEDGAPITAG